MIRYIYVAILFLLSTGYSHLGPDPNITDLVSSNDNHIIDGLTMVAPPNKFSGDPMEEVKAIGAGWISTVPYGFMSLGKPGIRFNTGRQWWGETVEGIEETIDYAHKNGIKVMLKPQIWSHTGWIGDQDFEQDKDWQKWEENYSKFILFYAEIASKKEVDMFCIGTELKKTCG